MGAPMGNCNACKNGSRGRKSSTKGIPKKWVSGKLVGYKKYAARGWYKKSAGRGVLKTIKRLSFG